MCLVLVRRMRIGLALARVARRRARRALSLAFGDAPLSLYVGWTAALVAIDLSSAGHLGLLGRYWFPVFPAALCVVIGSVARVASVVARPRVAAGVVTAWLAYAIAVAPIAFARADERFFGVHATRTPLDRYVRVERLADSTGATFATPTIAIARGSALCASGLAIDSRFGLPARGVGLRIDGRYHPLHYGIARTDPANIYNDDALRNIGFRGCVDTDDLAPGGHDARLIVVAHDLTQLRWPPHLRLDVGPRRVRARVRRAAPRARRVRRAIPLRSGSSRSPRRRRASVVVAR